MLFTVGLDLISGRWPVARLCPGNFEHLESNSDVTVLFALRTGFDLTIMRDRAGLHESRNHWFTRPWL